MLTTEEQFALLNYVSGSKRTSRIQRIYNLAYTYLARLVTQDAEIKVLTSQLFRAELRIKTLEQRSTT